MPLGYVQIKRIKDLPRLPLEGSIDLTYCCNDNCRHCWLRIPANAKEKTEELEPEEIKDIVDEARKMGCRKWSISGGEPMLRPDFPEIFDYITSNCVNYSLNTNGTLITPRIAKLMKRKGSKMVALYGATAQVHDYITCKPGSFAATMRGFAYLKEAGAGFIVQIIPMRDNYHQFKEMVHLAESLSHDCKIGAPWLYLSACGGPQKNEEIIHQRLDPKDVISLDRPDIFDIESIKKERGNQCFHLNVDKDESLFNSCIVKIRDFHIDPYGKISFCCFIKDPALRYDIRKGSFKEYWEEFIPSLIDKTKGAKEYLENCGSCELRQNCRWCPAYAYLEKRRFPAKIDYLCQIAEENKKFEINWLREHRRYYRIADITMQLDSDLPFDEKTFQPMLKAFQVDGPGEDTIYIRHHFSLPDLDGKNLGKEVYRRPPWQIYKKEFSWIYFGIPADDDTDIEDRPFYSAAVFNHDYTQAQIYNKNEKMFRRGNLSALTLFSTDAVFLTQVLANKQGCCFHSSGVILNHKGLLFLGRSESGKSTMASMLKGKSEILCDERIIVRKRPEGFKIYGTWNHGSFPEVSANCAPLKAILFLKKSTKNRLTPLIDKKEIITRILSCLIRPLVTIDWWNKTLSLVEQIVEEIPCYVLEFDLSGRVAQLLDKEIK